METTDLPAEAPAIVVTAPARRSMTATHATSCPHGILFPAAYDSANERIRPLDDDGGWMPAIEGWCGCAGGRDGN
jgi:hypothetical protein